MSSLTLKITPSGVRGIVGESLTPQLTTAFAAAFGSYCGGGPVLVGGDEGPALEMLRQAAFAGLLSVGSPPVDLGLLPLPALMLAVRQTRARGALCISGPRGARAGNTWGDVWGAGELASPEPVRGRSGAASAGLRTMESEAAPAGWSTLRFLGSDGSVLRSNQAAELTDLYHQGVLSRVPAHQIPALGRDEGAVARHRAVVLAAVDAAAIAARRFRVVIDPSGGSAAPATRGLLAALGCQVLAPPDLSAGGAATAVQELGADLGLVQDADGARLALIDERGESLLEDATLAIVVDHWLRREPGPVVVSVPTSHLVDAAAALRHGTVSRTRVGENHVLDRMRELDAAIGGEGDGGVIVAPVNPCRDSLVALALVLEALATEQAPLSKRFAYLRTRALLRETLLCPPREVAPALRWLRQVYQGTDIDLTDGVKVSWGDRWLHARPSHSEPVIRLTAEARTRADAQALLSQALEHLSPQG
jgi:phosphomannomutase